MRRTLHGWTDGDVHALAERLVPDGEERVHQFSPHGLSVTRVGTSGTVAVHTWPELEVATVDAYGTAAIALESHPPEDPCPS